MATEELEKNLFRATARYYDLDGRDVVRDDIPFFVSRARDAGGPVLELACGTGRVSIPLAEAGFEVYGVDLSREMLEQLEAKRRRLPEDVRQRLHIFHGDMCYFDFGRQFRLIIIPFRAFQALVTDEQQQECLACVRRHLAPGGQFILDVFRPCPGVLDRSWEAPEEVDLECDDPETGCHLKRSAIRRRIDVERQVIYPELIYYVTHPDGRQERLVELLEMKYYYEDQMRRLLQGNGFRVVEEMGYYDGRPISEGPELLFVCTGGKDA